MQTIEEYMAYTKQLEDEVSKWHHAYDALVIECNQLVKALKEMEAQRDVAIKKIDEIIESINKEG